MNEYEEAENLFSSLLEMCIERYEIWHRISCMVISNLSDNYEKKGAREKGLLFVRNYISRFHTSLIEASGAAKLRNFDILDAKYRFGRSLSLCDAHDRATLLLEEVAAEWPNEEKHDDDFIDLLQRLRYSYSAQNPPELEAEHKTCTELVKWRSQLDRPESTTTLNKIEHLVVCLRRLKHFKEAVKMQKQLIEARKHTIGIENEATLKNVSYLAEIYDEIPDWPKAIEARQELHLTRRKMDPDSLKTIAQASHIAALYAKLEQWDYVIDIRKNEAGEWRRVEGPDSRNDLIALFSLADGFQKPQRYTEARQSTDEIIEIRSRIFGPSHADTIEAPRIKVRICRKAGELDEAEQNLDQVLSMRSKFPAKDATRCLALASPSAVHMARGRLPRAIEFFGEAWTEGKTVQGSEHQVALAQLAMAVVRDCDAAQRWKEAENAIDKALLAWRAQQTSPALSKRIRECEKLLLEVRRKGVKSRTELMPA